MGREHTKAGQLRHRVDLQKLTTTRDATYNTNTSTWNTVAVLRAAVVPVNGREFFEAKQVAADVSHKVQLRYYPNITSTVHRFLAPKEYTTLSAAIEDTNNGVISLTDTSFFVEADEASGPTTDYILRVDSEDMIVKFGSSTVTTTTRGAFNTTAATHANGAVVTLLGEMHIVWIDNVDTRNRRLNLFCKEATI